MLPWKGSGLAALILVTLSLPTADGAPRQGPADEREWGEGPVQWLFLQEEWKLYRQARRQGDLDRFIEAFWSRRDPRPELEGNPFRDLFRRRVEAADLLYTEGGVMGSLTDRGRAFILLGSPAHVRVTSEPALAWTTDGMPSSQAEARSVAVETWGFRLEDLPEGLLEIAGQRRRGASDALSLTLSFRTGPDQTVLIEGDVLLELAAHALVRRPLP